MIKKRNEPPKDIRVVMSFKNNLILALMEKEGYKSVAELSRAVGIGQAYLGELINMKELPTTKDGKWRVAVVKLANFFKCFPEDLFSEFQQENVLEKNRAHAEMHYGQIQALLAVQNAGLIDPFVSAEKEEMRTAILEVLTTLPPVLEKVLKAKLGIDGPEMSNEEIARAMGCTRGNIYHLQKRALRLLRHPSRSELLRDFLDTEA